MPRVAGAAGVGGIGERHGGGEGEGTRVFSDGQQREKLCTF